MKIFHLNNPASGNSNGHKHFPLINRSLESKKITHVAEQTKYAGHGTTIVRDLDFNEYDALVVSGGDGTIFEALNGYFVNGSSKRIPLAVVPVGRGNAFARDIDLHPNTWNETIDVLLNGRTKKIDAGSFRMNGDQFYFLNILGFGFVTDVAGTALKLCSLGHLSYILGVLYETITLSPYKLKIEIDGKPIERENVFVEISNTRYTGKDFLMAPAAKIDDGYLDVVLLNRLSRARLLKYLPMIFTGKHVEMNEVETYKAKKIKIETEPAKLLTPDGQLMGSTPIEVECLPEAIEVFVK